MHQRSKHYRLFGNISYMFAAAMVIAALMVNAIPPRVASAHAINISSGVTCDNGSKKVTWTISNDWSTAATVTASSDHSALSIGTSIPAHGSINVSQTYPNSQTSNVSFSASVRWPDNFTDSDSHSQKMNGINCTPPPPDVCPNIAGNQATMPVGYQLDNNGNCVPIPPPPTDVCPNIDGVQSTMPVGYQLDNNGNCVPIPPPPTDLCPNIDGVQTTMPVGYQLDNNGNCVPIPPPPTDVCPNIDGVQTTMPVGYQLDNNGNCVPIPPPPTDVCPNIDGVQTTMPLGYQYDNNGNCVPIPPPPTDVCPNIDGLQTVMPVGYQYDNNANCVPIPPPPTDVCPNIDGLQTVVPDGMQHDVNGNCVPIPPAQITICYNNQTMTVFVTDLSLYPGFTQGECPPPPVDLCPNLDGVQTVMPDGYQFDVNGNCVPIPPPPVDLCPNLEGVQTVMPDGYQFDVNGNCVPIPPPPVDLCPNLEGVQTVMPDGYQFDVNGNCVPIPPPPVDLCPNLEGVQTIMPEGLHLDTEGNCVPIPPAQITICYNNQVMTVFVTDLGQYPGFLEGDCPPPPVPTASINCYSLEDGAFRVTITNTGPAGNVGLGSDLDSIVHDIGFMSSGETRNLLVPGTATVLYLYGKLQTGWTDAVSVSLDRSAVGSCEEDPISLTFTCSQNSESPSAWQVTNLNNFAINITWAIDSGPTGGPIAIPAHGVYNFNTAYYPGEMNVYVDGVLLAHSFAQNCNERTFKALTVAAFCTSANPGTYGWRVTNPNPYSVDFEYRINGSILAGTLTVGGNGHVDFQTAQSIGSIVMIYYGATLEGTANGLATCSGGPPPGGPTATPPVIPPTGGNPVLIPVTGLDLSTPGLPSKALFNLGLVFFGLGIVLQGLARRRETNE